MDIRFLILEIYTCRVEPSTSNLPIDIYIQYSILSSHDASIILGLTKPIHL
jgi:hypothetical protein